MITVKKSHVDIIVMALAVCVGLLAGCGGKRSGSAPGDGGVKSFSAALVLRTVPCSSASELTTALSNAQAGDEIVLAAGVTFTGNFKGTANGNANNPIIIRSNSSSNKAILKGKSNSSSITLQITGDYWIVKDLKLTYSQKGLVFDNANYGQAINCEIYDIGMEGLHFRDGSKYGLADGCYVHDTGQADADYGEAIYVGTDKGSWSTYAEDVYDTVIRNCQLGPNVTAEHIDIKEGTRRTIVEYCTFNGTGMGHNGAVANGATGFVAAKGVDAIVRYNTGNRNGNSVITDAFHLNNRGVADSGTGNWFYNNTVNLDNSTAWVVHIAQGTCTYKVWNNTRTPSGNMYETINNSTYTTVAPDGSTPTSTPKPTATAAPSATPTATRPPSATPTPTPTSTGSTGGTIKVQYDCDETGATANRIKPLFRIYNTGGAAVDIAKIKVRYYYTIDGEQTQNFYIDYASGVSSSNCVGTFVKLSSSKTGADYYLELSFKSGAGSIAPGESIQVKTRWSKSDFANYTQTGDYSFDPTKTAYTDWSKTPGYYNGALSWGTEP